MQMAFLGSLFFSQGSSGELTAQLVNITHPIEGTLCLVALGVLVRWRFPGFWNNLLEKLSVGNDDINTDL